MSGYTANAAGPGVEVSKRDFSVRGIIDALTDVVEHEFPPVETLLAEVSNLKREKWDWALPTSLLRKAYVSQYLDLGGALSWIKEIAPD
jgi:ATP-dependent Lhr-like helicase